MKNPLKTTIKDIAEIIAALEGEGVGVQITLIPIQNPEKLGIQPKEGEPMENDR